MPFGLDDAYAPDASLSASPQEQQQLSPPRLSPVTANGVDRAEPAPNSFQAALKVRWPSFYACAS